MASTAEESPGKLAPSSKKKLKDKSNVGSSLKGAMSNSLFSTSAGGSIGRMDMSEMPSFQNDRKTSSSSSDGKLGNFVTGLKNHSMTPEVSSARASKKKSGSESSTSGGSVSGGQGSLTNSAHPDSSGRHGLSHAGRGFSSCSSDGEDDREKEPKPYRLSRTTKSTKPLKPSLLESDDEATDSADEGNSGGEERGRRRRRGEIPGGVLGLRHSDRLSSRKDSSESTNSATSPVTNSTPHTTSTIFVESALPKEPTSGPLNMQAVGYGATADSVAPPSVFDKTPTQSPLGTPTMDSPKAVLDGQQSPGTPIPISPPSEEPGEVHVCLCVQLCMHVCKACVWVCLCMCVLVLVHLCRDAERAYLTIGRELMGAAFLCVKACLDPSPACCVQHHCRCCLDGTECAPFRCQPRVYVYVYLNVP